MTRKGELFQFYHVAIAADKVQGHRNYDAMYGFAEASSVAPRTFSMRRDDLDFVVFCFAKPEDAQAFCERFGGGAVGAIPTPERALAKINREIKTWIDAATTAGRPVPPPSP